MSDRIGGQFWRETKCIYVTCIPRSHRIPRSPPSLRERGERSSRLGICWGRRLCSRGLGCGVAGCVGDVVEAVVDV